MKTIIISGAGSGIGRATAQALCDSSEETCLVLIGRSQEKLQETLSLLGGGTQHMVVPTDTRDHHGLRSAFHELRLETKNVVGVVANAGVGGANHYGESDRWQEVIDINLTGVYRLVQEALPFLRLAQAPYRHIAIVSSVLAHVGVPGYSAYCASKAGLLGLTRSLAVELAPAKILVNAICPGWVKTQMADEGIKGIAAATGKDVEDVRAAQMSMVPLGKMSEPDEIGKLIRFLFSGEQTSVTGQALNINSGAWM